MAQLFSNNATTTLASGITAVATSITLNTGDGALFEAPTGGDFELITVYDGATIAASTNVEVMKVTARSTDTMTVVRAQEGTTGFAFSSGAGVDACLTAATLDSLREGNAGPLKGVTETIHTMTSAAVDASNGNWQTRTLAGNETLTFTIAAGQSVYVTVVPGANTLTLSNVNEWVGGSAPSTIEAEHAFVFWSDNGSTITGNSIGGIS
jgi:hypothetical protein